MISKITPFLIFKRNAKKALEFYVSIFEDASIKNKTYFENEANKIKYATFSLKGQDFICIDSSVENNFPFTPAISFYVLCSSDKEIKELSKALSRKGKVLMPLDKYGFNRKYAWIEDKFGISWQLVLE